MKDYEREYYDEILNQDNILLFSLDNNEELVETNIARRLFDQSNQSYNTIRKFYKAREADKKQPKQQKEDTINVKIDTKQVEKELKKLPFIGELF